jgi:ribonuclease HI
LQLLLGRTGVESKFVQQILNTAIIHTIWIIWIERNLRNFHNKQQSMSTLFNHVLAEVKLSFNLCMVNCNSSMHDYNIARLFNIPFRIKRLSSAHDIVWKPPSGDAVKFNCDGSVIGSNPCGAIGFVIRNSHSDFLGAMVSNIGFASSLEAEFHACLLAMERAQHMNLTNICLETDSLSVVSAYRTDVGIPWQLRARWFNCMKYCKSITCSCVHILREGNMVADALAKNGQGLSLFTSQWWSSPPNFIHSLLLRDSLGLLFSRLAMI